jgi:hypothetical protein
VIRYAFGFLIVVSIVAACGRGPGQSDGPSSSQVAPTTYCDEPPSDEALDCAASTDLARTKVASLSTGRQEVYAEFHYGDPCLPRPECPTRGDRGYIIFHYRNTRPDLLVTVAATGSSGVSVINVSPFIPTTIPTPPTSSK